MAQKNVEITFSPGFRWGKSLFPSHTIRCATLLDQTALTYPYTTVTNMSGETIKTILEDVADNLFNLDPYYQSGGDMVRVGGMQYTIDPARLGRSQNIINCVGGINFFVSRVGPAHAPEDLMVHVPSEKVLFAGDLIFRGRTHLLEMRIAKGG